MTFMYQLVMQLYNMFNFSYVIHTQLFPCFSVFETKLEINFMLSKSSFLSEYKNCMRLLKPIRILSYCRDITRQETTYGIIANWPEARPHACSILGESVWGHVPLEFDTL